MNVNELLEKIYIKAIKDKHTLQAKIKKKKVSWVSHENNRLFKMNT